MRYRFLSSWGVVLLVGCTPTAKQSDLPRALGGQASIWPALEPSKAPTADAMAGDNPWLTGFGGATSASGQHESATWDGTSSAQDPPSPEAEATDEAKAAEPGIGIIRAYWESDSANKLVTIENLGTFPLTECSLSVYSNGKTEAWRTLVLDQSVAPGARYTLCIPDAFHALCDQPFGGSAFNGDDAVVLNCHGTVHDAVGRIGQDPGDSWDHGNLSTRDQSLLRCSDTPDTDAFDAYAPNEWTTWDPTVPLDTARHQCPTSGAGGASMGGSAGH